MSFCPVSLVFFVLCTPLRQSSSLACIRLFAFICSGCLNHLRLYPVKACFPIFLWSRTPLKKVGSMYYYLNFVFELDVQTLDSYALQNLNEFSLVIDVETFFWRRSSFLKPQAVLLGVATLSNNGHS